MLVLTRRFNEAIHIGDDIRVVVVDVQGGKVRLGIDAPKNIRIDREEVRNRSREQREPCLQSSL